MYMSKGSAYKKAADAIYNLNYEIRSGEEAMKLPGIGKGIANLLTTLPGRGP